MAALSFLQRRASGVYEFRRRLPQAIAGKPAPEHVRLAYPDLVNAKTGCFKRELVASLDTKDSPEARRRSLKRSAAVVADMEGAVRLYVDGPPALQAVGLPPLDDIEAEVFRLALSDDDDERRQIDPRRYLQSEEEREAIRASKPAVAGWVGIPAVVPARGLSPEGVFALQLHLEDELETLRGVLAGGDLTAIEGDVKAWFNRRGLPFDVNAASDREHEVGLAIVRGAIRACEARLERLMGKIVPTPSPPVSFKGPLLSEAYEAWATGSKAKGGRKPSAGTLAEAKRAVCRFKDIHGDARLADVTPPMARQLRDALEHVPTRLTAKERAKPLGEILKLDMTGRERTHGATVNKSLNLLKAIVAHAAKAGLMDDVKGFSNPFTGVLSAIDERKKVRRKPFDAADLAAIFGTPIFTSGDRPAGGGGEAAFWFPCIALLSGARLGEIAQLRARDLRQEPGTDIWFFDFDSSGERTVKTASSRRQVPVHSELRKLGLIAYRDARAAAEGGDAVLWPEVTAGTHGAPAAPWSKWFGRYLRLKAGVVDPAKVFHSFRHLMKRAARDAGVPKDVHDAITGHTAVGDVGATYGGGFGLKVLAEAIEKLEVPPSVRALRCPTKTGGDRSPPA